MKILILLQRFRGGVGGGVKNISKELKNLGHEVDIIAREENLCLTSFPKSIIPLRKKVSKLMKEKNYDVIYTQDWSLAFPLIFPYPLFRKKHFCMFHGHQFGFGRILQNIIGKSMGRRLFCMAPSLKERFPNATMNYCGVNLDQFKPLNKKRKYIGWIAKANEIISRKEIEELGKKTNTPFLILGGLSQHTLLHEEMNSKFYNKCKVFISLPPEAAGFQASWLEAMAAGVPIVIGNNEGAGEVQPFDKVSEGKERDVQELIKIIKKPKKMDYRKWIIKNGFTWKNHSKRLIEIFKKEI